MVEKSKSIVLDKVIGYKLEKEEVFISNQDSILYSLGIGFSEDPLNKEDLNFTYEMAEDFQSFPTIMGAHALKLNTKIILNHPFIPNFNMMSLLHGEQWTEIINPIIPDSKVYIDAELVDFEDKGSGTIFMIGCNVYDEEHKILGKVKSVLFVRDIKGHGYKSTGVLKNFSVPSKIPSNKKPIKEISVETKKNQALLYRLGGQDLNPLHVDSQMSKMGGFDIPILHGMCFYGITCKAIYQSISKDNLSNIAYFNARFTSHVLPGETLIISIYNENNGKIIVSVKTKERGKQVLIGECLVKNTKF